MAKVSLFNLIFKLSQGPWEDGGNFFYLHVGKPKICQRANDSKVSINSLFPSQGLLLLVLKIPISSHHQGLKQKPKNPALTADLTTHSVPVSLECTFCKMNQLQSTVGEKNNKIMARKCSLQKNIFLEPHEPHWKWTAKLKHTMKTYLRHHQIGQLPLQRPCCCCCCSVTSVVSDSVRPHRWQPTRLPRPWDSPGKNTGVGCHCLLQCRKGKVKVKSLSHVGLLATPWTAAHQAPLSMGFSRREYWSGVP